MAVTGNNVVTIQTPKNGLVRFVGTTDAAGAAKTVYTAGANGTDISAVIITNGATAHNVSLIVVNSSTSYTVNALTVAVNAGQNGTVVAANLMAPAVWPGPLDANGNPLLRMNNGDTLQLSYATAQGTGDTIYGIAIGGDY